MGSDRNPPQTSLNRKGNLLAPVMGNCSGTSDLALVLLNPCSEGILRSLLSLLLSIRLNPFSGRETLTLPRSAFHFLEKILIGPAWVMGPPLTVATWQYGEAWFSLDTCEQCMPIRWWYVALNTVPDHVWPAHHLSFSQRYTLIDVPYEVCNIDTTYW